MPTRLVSPPPPIRYLLGEFVATRSDMEFVNGVAATSLGVLVLVSGDAIARSTGLRQILELIESETVWGLFLIGWAAITIGAWLCRSARCRLAAMFVSQFVWGFVFWQGAFGPTSVGFTACFAAALGAGSVVAFIRMRRTRV